MLLVRTGNHVLIRSIFPVDRIPIVFEIFLEEVYLFGDRPSAFYEKVTFTSHGADTPLQLQARCLKAVIVHLNALLKGDFLQTGKFDFNA